MRWFVEDQGSQGEVSVMTASVGGFGRLNTSFMSSPVSRGGLKAVAAGDLLVGAGSRQHRRCPSGRFLAQR